MVHVSGSLAAQWIHKNRPTFFKIKTATTRGSISDSSSVDDVTTDLSRVYNLADNTEPAIQPTRVTTEPAIRPTHVTTETAIQPTRVTTEPAIRPTRVTTEPAIRPKPTRVITEPAIRPTRATTEPGIRPTRVTIFNG